MRIGAMYSHLNGYEWLLVHKRHLWDEIESVIQSVDANAHKTKKSKEKTMTGKMLYSPGEINLEFKNMLDERDWRESKTYYWVTDDYKLIRNTMHLDEPEQKNEIENAVSAQ